MPSLRSQPELVPSPRGPLPKWCALGVAVVSMVMATILFQETVVGWVCVAVLLLSLCPLVHGIFLFLEEVVNHNNRYRGHSVLAHPWDCGLMRPLLFIVLSSVVLRLSGSPLPLPHLWILLWLCPVLYAALRSLGVLVLSEVELSDICETRQMNVAHGLAWSFYLGYLQLVLPRLEEAISAFCASHQSSASLWSRGSKRLFILIPINANISHKLENEDERVHFYDSLPNSQLDRGGVRGRVYKHSVYRVFNHKGQAHDCVLEYATPLLTLHSMSQDRSAAFGEPQRREQVLLFYRTLRDILERSLECRNRYTLILLNDEHEGDPHYLSKCILRHLHQQDTEEYPILPSPRIHPPQPEQTPLTAQGQHMGAWGGHRGQDLSKDPTLMFSTDTPRTLRGPVETSDGFKPKHNGYS
ncbi:stimulator of interferon genes protein [Periophthalmus magnuspinnatus]|uniref:stimulator of interferon genes protein n=1 Tax=Periophthalmus magnuspinnatus TaxID=409849 RepID=UPI00145B8A57|nr:stimulator of interferon genes protein [Periophthalmus magnuspinnatus]XP_055081072.1 stimulator of interferon genes protein [Periophthalmus magnuspinnatus]